MNSLSIVEQILQHHPNAKEEIKQALAEAQQPPLLPQWIPRLASQSIRRRIKQIQHFILQFQYNHTGVAFFATKRNRGMKHMVYTAKLIMKEALPIQCVEAVFLGVHLTNGLKSVSELILALKRIEIGLSFNIISSC